MSLGADCLGVVEVDSPVNQEAENVEVDSPVIQEVEKVKVDSPVNLEVEKVVGLEMAVVDSLVHQEVEKGGSWAVVAGNVEGGLETVEVDVLVLEEEKKAAEVGMVEVDSLVLEAEEKAVGLGSLGMAVVD